MASEGLTVAVTGPTGDLGIGIVSALERSRSIKRIRGMARRPFDPSERRWRKTEYLRGDVTNAASVRDLVRGADVVVHLAFAVLTASDATRQLNVEGSRRVFEEAMPAPVARLLGSMPVLKPVIPDPGTPFQLVHEDDVARAFVAGVRGVGGPGPYNLAGDGVLTIADVAAALGWHSLPVPRPVVEATAEVVTRLPLVPDSAAWIHSVTKPVLMRTDRARKLLRWRPQHSSKETLEAMVAAHRADAAAR